MTATAPVTANGSSPRAPTSVAPRVVGHEECPLIPDPRANGLLYCPDHLRGHLRAGVREPLPKPWHGPARPVDAACEFEQCGGYLHLGICHCARVQAAVAARPVLEEVIRAWREGPE